MIKIKSDKIIKDLSLFDGFIYADGGKICEVSGHSYPADEFYDFTGSYVSAGFIDMHTHGAGGYAFINSTVGDVIEGCNFHLKYGTTSILPTVTAGAFPTMRAAAVNILKARQSGLVKSNLLGAHLEGPYISAEQSGAQCPAFITKPIAEDFTSLIEQYGPVIKRWTYAPENDDGGRFCRYITSNGVIASIGHSNAAYSHVMTAIENGCNLVTHLYSCTSTVTRKHGFRSLGVIESTFLRDELTAEIIADGKHLPPELIRMIVKIKGTDGVILCTDSLEIAGTDVKSGEMSGTAYIVEDGVCKLKNRTAFAGSIATADRVVRVMNKQCGFSVPVSVKMITENPAKLLGLRKGRIAKDYDADFAVFDDDIAVGHVFVGGKLIF